MHASHRNGTYRAVLIALLAALLMTSHIQTAAAGNAVSRAIERVQPCGGVKTTKKVVVANVTIGVDKFKSAEIETLKVDVAGDKAKIFLLGSLACQTSDEATWKGDASVRFSANADVNLATCVADPVAVRILSTGGTFGAAISAFKGDVQNAVEKSIAEQARILCQ